VIEQACQHAATWPATTEDGAPPAVSVNLSSRDFDGSQLPSVIASALQATGLPAQRLMLEITETLMLTDLARSVEILYSLVDTGVQIALDDFGTGYCRSTTSVGFRCTG
ncbi:MAG TPA: EAL domain-containing protein, partial [Jatrophihabitans sp.]|nr:EAL domain-containing protein [Jatrophihabitans sp.]